MAASRRAPAVPAAPTPAPTPTPAPGDDLLAEAVKLLRARAEQHETASNAADSRGHDNDAVALLTRASGCSEAVRLIERELAAPKKGGR